LKFSGTVKLIPNFIIFTNKLNGEILKLPKSQFSKDIIPSLLILQPTEKIQFEYERKLICGEVVSVTIVGEIKFPSTSSPSN